MKCSNSKLIKLTLVASFTLGALGSGTLHAGTFQLPHSKQDRVIVYTYKTQFAHPVDYWWHLNPSESGTWDYYSPVRDSEQPLALERGTRETYGTPNPSIRQKVQKKFSNLLH